MVVIHSANMPEEVISLRIRPPSSDDLIFGVYDYTLASIIVLSGLYLMNHLLLQPKWAKRREICQCSDA